MAYGDKVLDHYENPRNVGTLDKNDPNVGTGLVGAPACGVSEDLAHTSIRFGIGRFNTDEEVDYVGKYVVEQVKRLREMSPLYEMANEGIDLSKIEWAAH